MDAKVKHPLYHIFIGTAVAVTSLLLMQQFSKNQILVLQISTAILSASIILLSINLYAHSRRLSRVRR